MMKLFFRLLALISLSVAVICAVVDASRSLAASSLMLTPLLKGWSDFAPASLSWLQGHIQQYLPTFMWDPVMVWVLNMPTEAILSVLAILFYMIGAKRHRPFGDFQA
jgi:hypothetical protein